MDITLAQNVRNRVKFTVDVMQKLRKTHTTSLVCHGLLHKDYMPVIDITLAQVVVVVVNGSYSAAPWTLPGPGVHYKKSQNQTSSKHTEKSEF